MRIVWLAIAFLVGCAAEGAAQRLVIEGSARHPALAELREIIARGDYRLIDRDTLIPAHVTLEGDLVVVDAAVRLEGAVTGSVGVVGGAFFVRPGARVDGRISAIAGTIGMSSLALVADTVSLPLEYTVHATGTAEEYVVSVRAPPRPPLVSPEGIFGVILPSYDRVNGATARLAVGGKLGADSLLPSYRIFGGYYSERGAVAAGGQIRVRLGPRARLVLAGGREVLTRDAWIRGDFTNSLSALFARSDVRDYYQSDFLSLGIESLPPLSLGVGEGYFGPRVRLIASRDRSLGAGDPWSLFGDEPWRDNPAVFHGTVTSAVAGFSAGWRGVTSEFEGAADLEWAFPPPIGDGREERRFLQLVADGHWSMLALWNHTLTVRGHASQTFGPDAAPPQRWSHVGGPGTLPTLETASLRGDNVLFLQSSYAVPLPRLTLPYAGVPEIAARHAVGTAWTTNGSTPRWEQNLALGVRFTVADLFLYVNPAERDRDPHLSVSLRLPF